MTGVVFAQQQKCLTLKVPLLEPIVAQQKEDRSDHCWENDIGSH
jgi:hypothetical protein